MSSLECAHCGAMLVAASGRCVACGQAIPAAALATPLPRPERATAERAAGALPRRWLVMTSAAGFGMLVGAWTIERWPAAALSLVTGVLRRLETSAQGAALRK